MRSSGGVEDEKKGLNSERKKRRNNNPLDLTAKEKNLVSIPDLVQESSFRGLGQNGFCNEGNTKIISWPCPKWMESLMILF